MSERYIPEAGDLCSLKRRSLRGYHGYYAKHYIAYSFIDDEHAKRWCSPDYAVVNEGASHEYVSKHLRYYEELPVIMFLGEVSGFYKFEFNGKVIYTYNDHSTTLTKTNHDV